MITAKDFDLPKELTPEGWKKNKGVIAKMKGFTGVGNALDAVADTKAKVVAFLAKPNFPVDGQIILGMTTESWKSQAEDKAKAFITQVEALSKAVKAAGAAAKAAAEEFGNSKVVPKSTTAYAQSVVSAATSYGKKVDDVTMKTMVPLIAAEIPAVRQKLADFLKIVDKETWKGIVVSAGKVQAVTMADFAKKEGQRPASASKQWNDAVFQPCRGMMAGLSKLKAQEKAITDTFNHYSKQLHNATNAALEWESVAERSDTVIGKVLTEVQSFAKEAKVLAQKFG